MRIKIRTSRWAIWARRLGSLAVPMLIIPVLLHWQGLIDSPSFHVVMLAAGGVALAAVLASLIALVRLWYTGDIGWGRALAGLVLGCICLLPFGWFAYLAQKYPPVTDMATTSRDELPLIFEPDTANMPVPKLLSPDMQKSYFPSATARTYPLDTVQIFGLIEGLVKAKGWDVRLRREPADEAAIGRLNARDVMLLGWREEAVLRVTPTANGSRVDMRSASINAVHDFGSNGNRISSFLEALDSEVSAYLQELNTVAPPVEDDAAPEVETGGA